MLVRVSRSQNNLPEGTYVELVRSVFATLMPTTIMGILFVATSSFVTLRTSDLALTMLAILGTILSFARVILLLANERMAHVGDLNADDAAKAEQQFAICYLSFALIIGLFGARSIQVLDPQFQAVIATLLVGYAAGVASGVSLRPWIAVPSVVLAITPSIVVALTGADATHKLLGFLLTMFMAGGLGSMVARYRSESEKITMRRMFGSLARQDHLTGLANRLGFAERFAEAVASPSQHCLVAIHCLDLDRFKPINDRYGHPVGDELLKAVGARLARVLRDGDTAARLGGDEFAVIQTGMRHPEEAELMARRLLRAIGESYSIDGQPVSVGTSIGYAVSAGCEDQLEDLIRDADQALYRAKKAGGGIGGSETARPAARLA